MANEAYQAFRPYYIDKLWIRVLLPSDFVVSRYILRSMVERNKMADVVNFNKFISIDGLWEFVLGDVCD